MFGRETILNKIPAAGGCTDTVDLYNPFPDGGGVALYQLNGDATDVSGNYDGTASNITYGAGQFGQAGVFVSRFQSTGTSQIDLNATILNATTYTVSMWVKPNNIYDSTTLYGQYAGNVSNRHLVSFGTAANKFKIAVGSYTEITLSSSFQLGVWQHLVVSKSETDFKVYLDGQQVGSLANTTDIYTGANTSIGNNLGGINAPDASIDQVRIFSRALRPYEVEALYTEEYCTPTIVPSEHFNTVTYTGNGSTQSITGVGFQPDFTWIKVRTNTDNHILQDSVRGVGKGLFSDLTNAENASMGGMTSFDSDGFTFDGSISSLNYSARDFVSWNFKAGGSAVTNTDGTITSQVSANTEAGFSVVKYTAGGTANVGHGLDSAPAVIITKNLDISEQWFVYHKDVGTQKFLGLNTTSAAISNSGVYTSITDTTYTNNISSTSRTYINYCFAEVEGFSNFGSYVGTGASGNSIVTGFEPAFVMMKSSSTATNGYWVIIDNKRSPLNPRDNELFPNDSVAEYEGNRNVNFLSNGFELTSSSYNNDNGTTYIYMAFAADPTTIEPSLEDSFNTVLYTGQNTDKQVTSVGFQPDLVWVKNRDDARNNVLSNSISGATNFLISNSTSAEITTDPQVLSFDIDGFTVIGNSASVNRSGFDFVAWCWKGAELPAINSNGSIPSVVSANPAAGFSIVTTRTNASGYLDFGHGLGVEPNVVIFKDRENTDAWYVYHSANTANPRDVSLILNTTAANYTAGGADKFVPSTDVFHSGNAVSGWSYFPNHNFIAYCFAEVAGFSKFGSYTGTGASGKSVTTDFEPAFILVKRTDAVSSWRLLDNKRFSGSNKSSLIPNSSAAEQVGYIDVDFNPTNFTINSTNIDFNASGGTYIFMAFANQF